MRVRDSTVRKMLLILGAVLLLVAVLAILREIPAAEKFVGAGIRLVVLFVSSLALLALAGAAMVRMVKKRDYTRFLRACFGVIAAVLLAVLVDDWVRRPDFARWLSSATPGVYLAALVTGIGLAEVGNWARRIGHPLLVFLATAVALLLMELATTSVPVDLGVLFVALFGISLDQLLRARAVRAG